MDLTYKNPRSAEELMVSNLIVKHRAGSHAYGTSLPTSDEDYRGIFCADPVNLLSPFFPIRECVDVNEEDTKFYELAHFMKLCLDCNPNIIETLHIDNDDIITTSAAYKYLRAHRVNFLSSKVAFTFSGYAIAQLKRLRGHHKWITNPQPGSSPKPCEFLSVIQNFCMEKNLHINITQYRDNYRLIPYGKDIYGVYFCSGRQLWDDIGNLNDIFDGNREELDVPIMIVKWNSEVYREHKEKWTNYWTWKKNRNVVRSQLEEKYNIDTKHAMHLVRLLRMGEEILRTGEVIVKRPDADTLLAIRDGDWTYEELISYAEAKDNLIRGELYKNTSLPKKPDIKLAARVLMETQQMIWDK